ncbi:MAG: radical SAM protein [Candidatus Thermoplasmatota archaeon]|nr:radical SAM protein [Candidatus Thermoplasmatota archaeon]
MTYFTEVVEKNMQLNRQELGARKRKLESYPIKLYVEPTQRCNLNCWMCDRGRRRSKEDMSISLFRKIEKELFEHVAEVDLFLNGEPLLSRTFPEMIRTSAKYSFLPKIFTNGLLLDENKMELLARHGVFVNISFDGGTDTAYDSVRGKGNFNRLIPKLRRFVEVGREVSNDRFHLRFAVTLGMHNIQEAPKIIRLASELGIDDVMFGALDFGEYHDKHLTSDPEKCAFFLKLAKKEADDLKVRFSCPRKIGPKIIEDHHNWYDFPLSIDRFAPFSLEENNPYGGICSYPWIETVIRSDGKVLSCCQKHHYMGDITQTSFMDIWNNARYISLRSQESYYECLGVNCSMTRYSIWK